MVEFNISAPKILVIEEMKIRKRKEVDEYNLQ